MWAEAETVSAIEEANTDPRGVMAVSDSGAVYHRLRSSVAALHGHLVGMVRHLAGWLSRQLSF